MNKTKKINIIAKKQKQYGGIMLKKSPEDAIVDFIENSSDISIFTFSGANGFIFSVTLRDDAESPYTNFRSTSFGTPVKHILIKIVATSPEENPRNAVTFFLQNQDEYQKRIENESAFANEVNIQTDIFLKTINYLEPLCPAPIYGVVKSGKNANHFLYRMISKCERNSDTIQVLNQFKNYIRIPGEAETESSTIKFPSIGILGMEVAERFRPLFTLYPEVIDPTRSSEKIPRRTNATTLYENMCRLQIIKLALETGYSQNDFHPSNLLIDPGYSGYYANLPGKVMIIDFGYATKIPIPILEIIKYNVSIGRYKSALLRLYNLSRSDGVELKSWPDFYGFIPDVFDYTYTFLNKKDKEKGNRSTQSPDVLNEQLDDLARRIDYQIDRRIEVFDIKHAEEPDKYPLLPVSNAVKNKLFSGIIQGGKRKRYRHKNTKKSRTCKKIN